MARKEGGSTCASAGAVRGRFHLDLSTPFLVAPTPDSLADVELYPPNLFCCRRGPATRDVPNMRLHYPRRPMQVSALLYGPLEGCNNLSDAEYEDVRTLDSRRPCSLICISPSSSTKGIRVAGMCRGSPQLFISPALTHGPAVESRDAAHASLSPDDLTGRSKRALMQCTLDCRCRRLRGFYTRVLVVHTIVPDS